MAREAKKQDIDGIQFTVQQLPAMRATRLIHKIGKAVVPALAHIAGGGTDLSAASISNIGEASQLLFDRLSADDLEAVIRELLEMAMIFVNGQTIPLMPVFDEALAGKTGTLVKLIRFALEVNYGDFLSAALAATHTALGRSPSISLSA